MKKITVIRGCEQLRDYFILNGIDNLYGENKDIIYWKDDVGEWQFLTGKLFDKNGEYNVVSFEEYFKTETKIVKMENTLYQVDEKFIKEAYKDACDSWKLKIEAKFPKLFELENIIGKTYIPADNSYAICLEDFENSNKHLTGGIYDKKCIIISKPYKSNSKEKGYNPRADAIHDFINVLYQNHTYMVLFSEKCIYNNM